MSDNPLAFYDHHRQSYGALPLADGVAAQLHVGGYGIDDDRGEFRIEFARIADTSDMSPLRGTILLPRLVVYGDAGDALADAMAAGLFSAMRDVRTVDEFADRLTALGFIDISDSPVGSPPPVCACCGQKVERPAEASPRIARQDSA